MITQDGWLDWAIRLPGPPNHANVGFNQARGIFMHSAEGYAGTLLDPNSQWGYNGNHSWHLSNLFDGRVFQHYPFTARTWHATAANNNYLSVENEGRGADQFGNRLPPGLYEPLNEAQIANARRFIAEIAQKYGWIPSRPHSSYDVSHTLWEHNEVTRLGGTGSSCPTDRIPWDKLLVQAVEENEMANLNGDGSKRIVSEGTFIVFYNGNVPVMRLGSTDGMFPGRVSKNFGGNWLWQRALDDNGNLVPIYMSETEGD